MRYTLSINAVKCQEWNINLAQGALFDLINQASSWAKACVVDGEVYYWMSRNKIVEEIPVAYTKTDTVYRSLKILTEKGLIDYIKEGKKDLIRMTEKGKTWNVKGTVQGDAKLGNKSELGQNSEINPSKLGNKSEKTPENSEINPTYKSTNYKSTNDKNIYISDFQENDVMAVNQSNADSIANWQAPSKNEMQAELVRAGSILNMTDDQYEIYVGDFKAHFEQNALAGKPLTGERNRKNRLRQWLESIAKKQPKSNIFQGNQNANHHSANHSNQPKQSSADIYAAKLAEQRRQRDQAANAAATGCNRANVYDMETLV